MAGEADTRVEQRADGWYDTERGVVLPLLDDIFYQDGIANWMRRAERRATDLERRGA